MIWGFHGISIMGVSKMVGFIMENPVKMDDERGYPYDLGNLHIYHKPE
jgi:hypothetical protein